MKTFKFPNEQEMRIKLLDLGLTESTVNIIVKSFPGQKYTLIAIKTIFIQLKQDFPSQVSQELWTKFLESLNATSEVIESICSSYEDTAHKN